MARKGIFLILWGISFCIFLLHFLKVGSAVYGDGRYYYSYLPTFLIQHTLDFTDAFAKIGIPLVKSPTGLLVNPYSPGPAIVWALPYGILFIILHVFFHLNEYSLILQIGIGLWNITLVIIGLYFIYKTLRQYFSDHISIFSTVTIFITTNLLFYGAIDVINSHSSSFFFASLITYLWIRRFLTWKTTLLLGFSLGMLFLIRTQDALFLLLPTSIFSLSSLQRKMLSVIAVGTAFLVFIPQLVLWKLYYGAFFSDPYVTGVGFDFLHPHIVDLLLNSTNGFLLWTPILLFGLIGIVLFTKKQKRIGIPILTIILLEIYTLASWKIWSEGASYSARGLISTLPLFAFGIAKLLENRWIYRYRYLFTGLFTLLNCVLITIFLLSH